MQTFFKENPEINQWVDLLIQKLLTVNILTGNDADSEFHEGRLLVEKIAKSFQEIIDLPQESLVDGIQQLVEQKLPDHRVVENFPEFYLSMHKIILAGLQNLVIIDRNENVENEFIPQQIASLRILKQDCPDGASSSKISLSLAQEMDSSFSLRHHLIKSMEAYNSPMFDRVSTSEELNELIRDTDNESIYDPPNIQIEPLLTESQDISISSEDKIEISEPDVFALDISLSSTSLPEFSPPDLHIEESLSKISLLDSEPEESFTEIELSDPQSEPEPSLPEVSLDEVSSDEASQQDTQQEISIPERELSIPDEGMSEDLLPSALPALSTAITDKPIKESNFRSRDPFRFNKREKIKSSFAENTAQLSSKPEKETNQAKENINLNTPPQVSYEKTILMNRQEVPEGCKDLERALRKVFPKNPISWYKAIEEFSYLAQCGSVLVYLADELNDKVRDMTQKMKILGYRVVVFQDEDLLFPRRIERALRRIAR